MKKLYYIWRDDKNSKGVGKDNIAWDTYPEDYPFTNEPKRKDYGTIR